MLKPNRTGQPGRTGPKSPLFQIDPDEDVAATPLPTPLSPFSLDQQLLIFRSLRFLVDKVRDARLVESGGRLSIELHDEIGELVDLQKKRGEES